MKSFKKHAVAAALASAAVIAGSAPAFAQDAGGLYDAHRVPNQVRPGVPDYYGYAAPRDYYDYAAPPDYYDYVAPRDYYDYVPPSDVDPAPNPPSAFYECPPKCW
jgi:hypothetical protein